MSTDDRWRPDILPMYVVCDAGGSTGPDGADQMNRFAAAMHSWIASDPVLCDKVLVSTIESSDECATVLPLSNLAQVVAMPGVVARGTSRFGAMFDFVRGRIEEDVPGLQTRYRCRRPLVLILTTGRPVDDWTNAWLRLSDPGWKFRPNVVGVGLPGCDGDVVRRISTVGRPGVPGVTVLALGSRPSYWPHFLSDFLTDVLDLRARMYWTESFTVNEATVGTGDDAVRIVTGTDAH